MATSPNYAWAEPDNSSLVKNGAADIRTLGDAIDTSVWNVGYGQAGKNKIINGDFTINQRSFTSNTTDAAFNFDRWAQFNGGTTGTLTVTPQTFTTGAAPIAGYEGSTFVQCVTAAGASTNTYAQYAQKIENVRTFAGQTVTVSFFAKASSGTPKVAVIMRQSFGSGGSPSAQVNTLAGSATISTAWARYSITVTVPSISGKTIGTAGDSNLQVILWLSAGSDFNSNTGSIGLQNNTFQFWGVQAEYGSKATPFQTATGTIQGETSACQRYFYRFTSGNIGLGNYFTTTRVLTPLALPTTMRIAPTGITLNSAAFTIYVSGAGRASSAVAFNNGTTRTVEIDITSAADTAGRVGSVSLDTGSFDVSAEL